MFFHVNPLSNTQRYAIIKKSLGDKMKNWLQDKTIVLTGASGGIGRQLCKLLVQKYGATVIGIGRSEEKMQSLCQELSAFENKFSYYLFDVSQRENWQNFKEELLQKGIDVHLLINNAGIFPSFQTVSNTSAETFEKVLQVNYLSSVYAVETLYSLLTGDKKDKPAIVNISSSAALCTVVGTAAYSASKAALKGYTEALQMEEKGKKYIGIVYPGTTATELFRSDENTKNSALDIVAMPADKMAKKIARRIVRKRKRNIVGWDAKLMNLTAKCMPVVGLSLIRGVMKASKSKVFKNVFHK